MIDAILAVIGLITIIGWALGLLTYIFPIVIAAGAIWFVSLYWRELRWKNLQLGDKRWKYDHIREEKWRKLYFVFYDPEYDLNYWYDWETQEIVPQGASTHMFRWWNARKLDLDEAFHIRGLVSCGKEWVSWWKNRYPKF